LQLVSDVQGEEFIQMVVELSIKSNSGWISVHEPDAIMPPADPPAS
jgi:hypothetical protein